MRWELGKDMAQRPSDTNKSVQTAATWGVPVAGRVRLSQVPSRTFRALLRVRPVQAAMSHRADGRLPNAECASGGARGMGKGLVSVTTNEVTPHRPCRCRTAMQGNRFHGLYTVRLLCLKPRKVLGSSCERDTDMVHAYLCGPLLLPMDRYRLAGTRGCS
jgi:hypothetical protein